MISSRYAHLYTQPKHHQTCCLLVAAGHSDVEGTCAPTRNGERYAEVRVECARASVALRTPQGGVVLRSKQIVYHAVMTLEVV